MASITKRGNTYRITVCNGRKADGTQIRATATFVPDPAKTEHQNQKALDRFVYEFEERVRNGKYLKGEKMTYKEFSSMWMEEHVRRQLSPTTYERNEIALRTIIVPAIGHLKLAQITPLHLQTLYRDMSEKGYEKHGKHKEYSNNTIKRVHQVISSSLNSAVLWQLIESNPCTRVKPPKVERSRKIRYFTLEQTEAFFGQLEQPYTVAHGGRRRRDGSESQRKPQGPGTGMFDRQCPFCFTHGHRAASGSCRKVFPDRHNGRECAQRRFRRACGGMVRTAGGRCFPSADRYSGHFCHSWFSAGAAAPDRDRRGFGD